jgi:hypothetical protein
MSELLRKALAEQEAELEKLDAEIAKLQPLKDRRDNILHLVSQMRFNLGMEPYQPSQKLQNSQPSGPSDKRPIWAVAKEILERSQKPMSSGEIAEILRSLGFTQLEGRPGRETVRSLLRKKNDVFVRLEDGRYELKKT